MNGQIANFSLKLWISTQKYTTVWTFTGFRWNVINSPICGSLQFRFGVCNLSIKKKASEREIRLYTKSPYTHQWIQLQYRKRWQTVVVIWNNESRRSVIIVSNENAMGAWSKKSKKWFIFHKSTIFLHCCSQPLITRLQFKILIASEINQR